MGYDIKKVNSLFDSVALIWSQVKPASDVSAAALEPFSKLVGSSSAGPIKHCHEHLQKCVEVSVALKKFTTRFAAPGPTKWKDASAILTEFTGTGAGAGSNADHQQAVVKLKLLVDFVGQLKAFSSAGIDFTGAAKLHADTIAKQAKNTACLAGNLEAANKANNEFAAVISAAHQVLPKVKTALQLAEELAVG
jgi:hypothetical protein